MYKTTITIFLKDMRILRQNPASLVLIVGFSLLIAVVASFALRVVGAGQSELHEMFSGICWLIICFSGSLVLLQTSDWEREGSALEGLLLLGVQPRQIFLAKVLTNFCLLSLCHLVVVLALEVLLGVLLVGVRGDILLVNQLGLVGFCFLGTLLAVIARFSKGRDFLLSLMFFPALIPLILAEVYLQRQIFLNGVLAVTDFWLFVLLAFDGLSIFLAVTFCEFLYCE